MRIAVVGAGALGSLFAALLARQAEKEKDKAEIWLIGSASTQPHLDAIAANGLHVQLAPAVLAALPADPTLNQPWHIKTLLVANQAALAYPSDLALVLVKSYRSADAARQVRALLAPGGVALTLQNGLGNLPILADEVEPERAAQGVTSLAATLGAPGQLIWSGVGPISLGLSALLDPARQSYLLDFADRLAALNLSVTTAANLDGLVWGKLIINCAINPLGALLNVPNGELLNRPSALELMDAAAHETAAIAQELGITLPYPYEDAANQAHQVAQLTANNINSMLSDVRRRRQTEIQAINGAVAREGQRLALPTPVNWTLTRLVEALYKF